MVLTGVAACTSIALRMYAERKGWNLGALQVSVALHREGEAQRIDRSIAFSKPLLAEQRSRFLEISEKTPVTRPLKTSIAIQTILS